MAATLWFLVMVLTVSDVLLLSVACREEARRSQQREAAVGYLERLVLANRHVEITALRSASGSILARHVPSGRDVRFSFEDLEADRTAVAFADDPVASQPGWRAAAWVPVYSGAQVESYRYHAGDGLETGELSLLTATPVAPLIAYYQSALRREGMLVAPKTVPPRGWAAQAWTRDRAAQIAVRLVPASKGTQILIEYAGR